MVENCDRYLSARSPSNGAATSCDLPGPMPVLQGEIAILKAFLSHDLDGILWPSAQLESHPAPTLKASVEPLAARPSRVPVTQGIANFKCQSIANQEATRAVDRSAQFQEQAFCQRPKQMR